MIIGDIINYIVILNSLSYAIYIIYVNINTHLYISDIDNNNYNDYSDNMNTNLFISNSVLEDGFCISNKSSLWFSSHALCFYVDTFFCFILYKYMNEGYDLSIPKRIMDPVSLNIIAHFGHGLGHFIVGVFGTLNNTYIFDADYNWYTLVIIYLWLSSFWFGFIQSIHSNFNYRIQLIECIIITSGQLFIPIQFSFTYVQTIILLLASINDLSIDKKHKDIYYTLKAGIVNLPIGLVGWLESYSCDNILIYIGGHLWYDCTIPISIITYYLLCKLIYMDRLYFIRM